MQKDDKKEILKFEIKGNEDGAAEGGLFKLSGSIVIISLNVGGADVCGEVNAEFVSMQRDSKKTTMKFGIKGDSEERAAQLYRYAGRNVMLNVKASQMTMDEFYEGDGDEGAEYTVNGDGTVDVKRPEDDPDQLKLEEAMKEETAQPDQPEGELSQETEKPKKPRGGSRSKSKDVPAPEQSEEVDGGDRKEPEWLGNDDDLPM
jgi:hypothetical protein